MRYVGFRVNKKGISMSSFKIAENKIGPGEPCFVIAEIAQAHDGSLGMAHAYIDAVATAGADAIKFQTHIANQESSIHEPWRVKFSKQDDTRYDYWKRMEFSVQQWAGLKKHADERGIVFLSSAFSIQAVEILKNLEMAAWKIASGEINNFKLLKAMGDTKKPIILSTGMSGYKEIDNSVNFVKEMGNALAILQCTTSYPTAPEKIGINLLHEYRDRYNIPYGLSDHSGTIYPGLACAAEGANILELHVTMSREMFGPDVVASITTNELKQLIEGMRFIEKMYQSPISKDKIAPEFDELRKIFTKSLFANKTLLKGALLKEEDIILLKPGSGIPADHLGNYLGKELNCTVEEGEMLKESFFKAWTK